MSKPRLNGLDWQILQVLQTNARVSISDLADKLNRSRSSISEHLKKLSEMGVTRYYSVAVNEEAIGVGISAFVRLEADSARHRLIVESVDQIPEVAECHVLTGTDLLMMRVVARDMPHLRELVDGFTRWGSTTTDVIFSTVKQGLDLGPPLRRKLEQ